MADRQDQAPFQPGSDALRRLVEANRRKFDEPEPAAGLPELWYRDMEAALVACRAEALAAHDLLRAFETSTSWRVTRPLRWLSLGLQKVRPVPPPAVAVPEPPGVPVPMSYEEWVATEEPGILAAMAKPGPGHQAVLPPRLGLVVLNGTIPDGCPDGCSILLLHEEGVPVPPAAPGPGHVLIQAVPSGFVAADGIGLALALLDVDMVCFLDGRERLAPEALSLAADAMAQYPQLDLVFADEDWLDAQGRRQRPFFKPGWDPELQRGRDLVGPFAFFRAGLVRWATVAAGPAWRYDLANQVASATRPERIHHIPAILCHRTALHAGHAEGLRAAAMAQLRRDGIAAEVGPVPGQPEWHRVRYEVPPLEPLVSIIVPTRDRADLLRTCADGVLNRTDYARLELLIVDNGTVDPDALALLDTLATDDRVQVLRRPSAFNWSALNNAGAAAARGDVLVLLNNDIAVLRPDWLTLLVSHALQPGVGAVGAKLLYQDGRVQHAGLTTDASGIPRHLFRYAGTDAEGAFGMLGLAREVWGLTGACMAIPRDVFAIVGGLNEALPIAYNDVDMCLRLTAHGYRLIWTPWCVVEHRELASRSPDHLGRRREQVREERDRLLRDWGAMVLHDPFLNPNLCLIDEQPCLGAVVRQAEVIAGAAHGRPPGTAPAAMKRVGGAILPALLAARTLLTRRPAVPVPRGRGFTLVIDDNWPRPDRDAGSVEIVSLMEALGRLGFGAVLAAAKQHDGEQPARDHLMAQGVRCLQPADASSVEHFIIRHGPAIDLVVLCRVYCGGEFLELVQEHCPGAKLVFNAIDLNYLREERKARLLNDQRLLAILNQVRQREEHVIRSCAATMVVSQTEVDLLGQTMPGSLAVLMPLARPVHRPMTPFTARHGIGFIGNFSHAPNVDAISYFLTEIWPTVRTELPDCVLTIVGPDAPEGLLGDGAGGGGERVRLLGHVPDIGPWLESLRLTVAPLRYGAGAKGKVVSSLAAGVPCVATPIAAEGMSLSVADGVLVASDPAAFAKVIIRAYGDEMAWQELSNGGLAYAETTLSPLAWQDRLDRMLKQIGL